MSQKLWNAAKGVLRWKLISLNTYVRKEEWLKVNEINIHLKRKNKSQINSK